MSRDNFEMTGDESDIYSDKISKSDVINIGISDHSAIYLKRKVTHLRSDMHKTVEVRQLKNLNEAEFLRYEVLRILIFTGLKVNKK